MKSSGFHIKSCVFHHWNHLNQIIREKTLHFHIARNITGAYERSLVRNCNCMFIFVMYKLYFVYL